MLVFPKPNISFWWLCSHFAIFLYVFMGLMSHGVKLWNLKLSVTEVAVSLPGIAPKFSFFVTLKCCCLSACEFDDVWASDYGDIDDGCSVMSNVQSKSSSVMFFFLPVVFATILSATLSWIEWSGFHSHSL